MVKGTSFGSVIFLIVLTASLMSVGLEACQPGNLPNPLPNKIQIPAECDIEGLSSNIEVLSPDNEWLLCRKTVGNEEDGLYVKHISRDDWMLLASYDSQEVWDQLLFAAWSPDSKQLAVTGYQTPVWLYRVGNWNERTAIYDYVRGGEHKIHGWVDWSPDGEYLTTLDTSDGLLLIHTDGSGSKVLLDLLAYGAPPAPEDFSWSPDGSYIAYRTILERDYHKRRADDVELCLLDIKSLKQSPLYPPTDEWISAYSPVWSPINGSLIAFVIVRRDGERGAAIALQNLDTLDVQIFELPEPWEYGSSSLTWSPEGQYIAILESGETSTNDILLLAIETGSYSPITTTGHYQEILKWTEQGIVALTHEHTIEVIPVEN
jgi:Tol biopolymer transport system component